MTSSPKLGHIELFCTPTGNHSIFICSWIWKTGIWKLTMVVTISICIFLPYMNLFSAYLGKWEDSCWFLCCLTFLLYVIRGLISSSVCFIIWYFYSFVHIDKEIPKVSASFQMVQLGYSWFCLIMSLKLTSWVSSKQKKNLLKIIYLSQWKREIFLQMKKKDFLVHMQSAYWLWARVMWGWFLKHLV